MPPSSATETHASVGESLQILTLGLAGEIFAVETERVHEVLDPPPITRIPNSRPFIKGLIDVRGKVITVTDLHVKFGMAPTAQTTDTRIVVIEVQIEGEPTLVGTLADRVYEVTELPLALMEDAPRIGMRWRPEFIRAIGRRDGDFIIVADIDQVFASEESVWHASHQDAAA
ncbi:MAG: chemotaxis protein CheW [Candidatus Competibacteraceae bacterium]|nr:chemotaxis protein CheW [Candidatus Competibacteraceae bacterium]MCB1821920.1 chemotaxis protein CheW [Candidatus Competibacteraceae bacterium]HRY14266.1 chemotaxis protein CheW [Candidatus Competibacteraceae bacterium]